MKLKYLLIATLLLGSHALWAQVKIGDRSETIDPASLLELESADRVLVITRLSTAQMQTITPLNGAVVYNTDESCLFYYNGQIWINLCDALGLSFTNEAIVNQDTTIIITEFEDRLNFEVGQIRGENIVDFSIGSQEIQNNAINSEKLAPNSVGTEEIQDNAVTTAEIDLVDVTLSDFVNDVPFLVAADLIAANVGYDGTTSGLAATNVQDAIDLLILGADFPFNTDFEVAGDNLIITDFGGALEVPLADINNQDLATDGTPGNISLTNGGSDLTLNVDDGDADPLNEIQDVTSTDGTVLITPAGINYDLSVPAADGSETIITPGDDIDIAGSGTAADPYVITNTFIEQDDDPINEIQTITSTDGSILITAIGNDYDLAATPSDGSETVITAGDEIAVTGSGTAGDPYIVSNTFVELDGDPANENQTVSAGAGITVIPAGQDFQVINDAPDQVVTLTDGGSGNVTIGGVYPNFTIDVLPGLPAGTPGAILSSDGTGGLLEDPGELFWDTVNNRLGIGTDNPQNKLQVTGEVRSQGYSNSNGTENEPSYAFTNDPDTGMWRGANTNFLRFSTNGTEAMTIDPLQNVGIGIDPAARLHVNGDAIILGDITANSVNTPDYVFQKYFSGQSSLNPDYEMMTLEEVFSFVRKHGHLPGIPSAKDVAQQGGILLNRSTELNLEKIEELFLYTIEQEEKIKILQQENHTLSEELKTLENRLETIEKLLHKRKSR